MKKEILIKIKQNKIIMTILAIACFWFLGEYCSLSTGISDSYIYLQYPILCLFAARYGGLIGFIIGFTGHLLIDLTKGTGIWWTWIFASGFIGFIIGYIFKKHKLYPYLREEKRLLYFCIICMGSFCFILGLCIPFLNILFYKIPTREAFTQGLFAAFSDGAISVIFCNILFSSFRSARKRRIIACLFLLNSLLLLSYGNKGLSCIIIYVLAIIFCTISYLHNLVDNMFLNERLKIIKVLFVGLITFTIIIISFLFFYAYTDKPAGDEEVMIVLGAGLNNEKPNKVLAYRLDKAAEYAKNNPNILIITSGGQGADEVISESLAMGNYLIDKGIDSNRIIMESNSKTTEENFKYSLNLMKEIGLDESSKILFVTNDFHCFRAKKYAQMAGFKNIKYLTASTPLTTWLPNYIREILALIKFMLKYFGIL